MYPLPKDKLYMHMIHAAWPNLSQFEPCASKEKLSVELAREHSHLNLQYSIFRADNDHSNDIRKKTAVHRAQKKILQAPTHLMTLLNLPNLGLFQPPQLRIARRVICPAQSWNFGQFYFIRGNGGRLFLLAWVSHSVSSSLELYPLRQVNHRLRPAT